MGFTEAVASLAVSCFLLGLVVGFFARYFWNTYCNTIEEGTDGFNEDDEDDVEEDYDCDEDDD